MKVVFVLTFFIHTSIAHAQSNELNGLWLFNLEHKDIGSARMIMKFDADAAAFEGYTRENADKDILGGWTAMLGRLFTPNFKRGSLLRVVNGVSKIENDTLRLKAIFTSAMGNLHFTGSLVDGIIHVKLTNGKDALHGTMEGQKVTETYPLENYIALIEKASAIAEENIYNRELLETKDWKQFGRKMKKVAPKIQDDLELVFAHFYYAGKLPVSHYALLKLPERSDTSDSITVESKCVFLEEKSPETAYLKIESFGGSAAEMHAAFDTVIARGYKNLIVDLRNNTGGSVAAGMAFATSLADTTFYGGIFLTQKWFNEHPYPPTADTYIDFPHFTESNYNLIMDGIHNTKALCLKVIPRNQTYTGKLFILTNGATASTCEPIVYGLKQQKRALIVGEKTAGAMLNGERFKVDGGFTQIVPTADYYTADGNRIDQKGVTPDIEVNEHEALEYVLRELIH